MRELFTRHPDNPIVRPGGPAWRRAVTFNPGVTRTADGRTWLWERTAGSLRPFQCHIGLQTSEDGVHFTPHGTQPVLSPAQLGSAHGSVQDPRVVVLEDTFYLSFAYRPFAWASHPTGVGVPESEEVAYPEFSGDSRDNQTRSGLARSSDGVHWDFIGWVNDSDTDDRNVILFPERIAGRYVCLRRPSPFVTTQAAHQEPVGIKLSTSEDLVHWSEPVGVLEPQFAWESNRIGGSTPPIRVDEGWLITYHGVETTDPETRSVIYRMGAAIVDGDEPTRVIARNREPLFEPQAYYERVGVYIPNTVFPSGAVVLDDEQRLYYGCCDTAIGLATASLRAVVDAVLAHPA